MIYSLGNPKNALVYALLISIGIAGCSDLANTREASAAQSGNSCLNKTGFKLINGRILTMDAQASVVSSLTVDNDKIVAVGEESGTIEEVYEPYLIQEGYLKRTPQGRVATELCYKKFGIEPNTKQRELL